MEIENIVFLSGYSVIICYSSYDFKKEITYLEVLKSKKVDGLIIVPTKDNSSYINNLVTNNVPVVVINRSLKNTKADSVVLDDFNGMFNMTQYLIELGHKRIAYIDRPSALPHSANRLKGYKKALKEHGINFDRDLLIRTTFGIKGGILAFKEILSKNLNPTAIMAFNDLLAIGLLSELNRMGIKIPEDISLTGFDDILFSASSSPPLTTVYSPKKEMAQYAFSILQERMNKHKNRNKKKIVLKTKLIIRESTASPKNDMLDKH